MAYPLRSLVLMIVTGVLVVGAPARTAEAWGPEGHRIVCGIAWQLLSERLQMEVDRLTETYRTPDGDRYRYFTGACVLADTARGRAQRGDDGWSFFADFGRWHFLNVPRSTRRVRAAQCGGDCVLEGIRTHHAELADVAAPDWRRARALFLLGHWVGDVHQPLHVSFGDDRGGNDVRVGGRYYRAETLHGVWDSGILRRAQGNRRWWSYATSLRRSVPGAAVDGWRATEPLAWAQESYDISTEAGLDYCELSRGACRPEPHRRVLGAAYQRAFEPIVERRLQQAGVRLAGLIAEALGP